jgi:hypothetical protein
MSQELVTQQHQSAPFAQGRALAASVNAGAVSVEQERAVAEAQGQLVLAKKFPRDNSASYAELMESCKMPAFAAVAFYSVPRGGGKVTGPSIRLAEEIARCYGNFSYGHRELSRSAGKSEVEVYAWDMEKNNRRIRQITVEHVIDTRDGPKKMRDSKEIDDKISNVASKQVRGLMLALMPKWMVESAIEECRKTLAGNNDEPISVRVRKMTQAFARFGVTTEHLERHLGHKLDDVLADELVDLMGVFNSLKEGTPASEFFGQQEAAEAVANTAEAIKATAAAAPRKAAAAKPEPAPAAAQQESKAVTKPSNPVKEQPAQAEVQEPTASPADDGADVF